MSNLCQVRSLSNNLFVRRLLANITKVELTLRYRDRGLARWVCSRSEISQFFRARIHLGLVGLPHIPDLEWKNYARGYGIVGVSVLSASQMDAGSDVNG